MPRDLPSEKEGKRFLFKHIKRVKGFEKDVLARNTVVC
jgi:hypothetical protein